MKRVKFPDGVYIDIDSYAESFDIQTYTVKRKIKQGILKKRILKGEIYVKAYNK